MPSPRRRIVPGVIAVAGLRHAGTKVGFSDLGPEIALSAPAGNCVNIGVNDPCLYPILTTANPGTTVPVPHAAGGSTYTDSFNASIGTSFSAPLVAGTAALMLSAQPALSPTAVRSLLQATARPFPSSGGDTGENRAAAAMHGAPVRRDDAGRSVAVLLHDGSLRRRACSTPARP